MILSVGKSPRATKRFRAIWTDSEGKEHHTDFGQPGGFTFIDGAGETVRRNYWKRHIANPSERAKIVQLTPSAAVYAAYLLWGESDDLQTNIRTLNRLMK